MNSENTEETLLQRARNYDGEALGQLYDRYAPAIYRYLYRSVHDAQLAEDLTGDVFVRMLRAAREDRFSTRSFKNWLYRIAHNLVIDHLRKKSSDVELGLDERLVAAKEDLDAVLMGRLSRQDLRAAIGQLTTYQQQVLALRFGQQLTARETAEIMGKRVGAVEALQHRALNALRRLLKDIDHE